MIHFAPCRIRLASRRLRSTILVAALSGSLFGAAAEKPAASAPPEAKTTLPASVDLEAAFRAFELEPRAQGGRPTCSVFVVTQALELAVAKKTGQGRQLSVEFLNWASNRETRDRSDGGNFADIWKGFQGRGICTEEALPYQAEYNPRLRPSEDVRSAAQKVLSYGLRLRWIKEWDSKRGLNDDELREVRSTLARGFAVCGGFLWPKQQVWKDKTLQMCERDAVRDGHSVLLVGYRDDPALPGGGVFMIRNSASNLREGLLTYEFVKAYMNDAASIAPEEATPAPPAPSSASEAPPPPAGASK